MRVSLAARGGRNSNRYRFLLMAFIIASVFSSSAFAAAPKGKQESKTAADKAYIVGIGDILSIQVWKEPELSRTLAVRTDGRISLPLVGDVDVAGKSIQDLTTLLSKKYSRVITEPSVTVTLVENRSKRYYLIGQVQQPGEFPIDHPITILQAIARGGGFLEWAKRDEIAVIRRDEGKEKRLQFDYDAFIKGKKQEQNIMVAPGDTIVVP